MRSSVLVLALASSLAAGAALADPINPGVRQMAAQAGVDASNLSTAEVVAKWAVKHDGYHDAAVYRTRRAAGGMMDDSLSNGVDQLATQAGVDPTSLSTVEVAAKWEAQQSRHHSAAPYKASYRAGAASGAMATMISPGRAQLAAQLGVDPALYTAGELYSMKADLWRD